MALPTVEVGGLTPRGVVWRGSVVQDNFDCLRFLAALNVRACWPVNKLANYIVEIYGALLASEIGHCGG